MRPRQRTAIPAILLFAVSPAGAQQWKSLFDGKTLAGWRETAFSGRGKIGIENGAILLRAGAPMTGINYTGPLSKTNYEVRFEASRLEGNDFFASLTFPAGDAFATLVTGGWGGDIVGISSIDGWDASDNETRSYVTFEDKRWYGFRLRVTNDRISVWIDDQPIIDVVITGRALSLRHGDIKLSAPFGFASYNTAGSIRKIEYRAIP